MAWSRYFLLLLVISLGISNIIPLHAIPASRTTNLMHVNPSHLETREGAWQEKLVRGRMNVELEDYPGSGANNKHTPRAQFARGCVDC